MPKKILKGTVVSAKKAFKTVVVKVVRNSVHPLYRKMIRISKKYSAHDENSVCNEGDIVSIQESRPISKTKKWVILEAKNIAE